MRGEPMPWAATRAPAEAPTAKTGAATAPPMRPESAPGRSASASAARFPQE